MPFCCLFPYWLAVLLLGYIAFNPLQPRTKLFLATLALFASFLASYGFSHYLSMVSMHSPAFYYLLAHFLISVAMNFISTVMVIVIVIKNRRKA